MQIENNIKKKKITDFLSLDNRVNSQRKKSE